MSEPSRPRALIFAPFSPYPCETGAHVHCVMVLEMVRRLGYEPVFASSTGLTDAPWSPERISRLARDHGALVELHEPSVLDAIWYGLQDLQSPEFSDVAYVTPSLALWFEALVARHRPALVLVNYAKWGRLIDCDAMRGIPAILVTHDLLSVNRAFQKVLDPYFQAIPLDLGLVQEEVLRETFLDGLDQGEIPGLREELSVFGRFASSIMIADHELERVHRLEPLLPLHTLPMVYEPRPQGNTHALPPVFLAHTNNFNYQGIAWFARKVLPLIRKEEPAFVLRVAGNLCRAIKPVDGLELLGFVEDLDELYLNSRFALCPLLGGTGQQVKVMEAMSFGLPVVLLPRIARATGVVDGVHGLVAPDAPAFAEACLRLWRDPELARSLGEAARAHMRDHHSFEIACAAFAREMARIQAGSAP